MIFVCFAIVFTVDLFIFSLDCHMIPLKYLEKETTIHNEI